LRPLTQHTPKCLLEINGVSILENCLNNLDSVGVKEALIVVGHLKEAIFDKIGTQYKGIAVSYVFADQYEITNNIVSLQWAITDLDMQGKLDDNFFLIESDVLFSAKVLRLLAAAGHNCSAAVSYFKPHMNGTVVKSSDGYITEMILDGSHDGDVSKTVNIYYLNKFFMKILKPFINAWIEAGYTQDYYEAVFADLIKKPKTPKFIPYLIHDWAEIDDIEDLKRVQYQFSTPEKKYETVSNLHGYFWPYGVQDHCHLYNMYFPPQEMMDYFQSNFKQLVTTYPSGHKEIAYFLSEWLGVDPDCLVIGNGASELIKLIGSQTQGICVSTPSFNEFEECASFVQRVPLNEDTWEFDKDRFLATLNSFDAPNLPNLTGVIVTPNNPTSIAVEPEDIIYVLENTKRRVIVDESFIDFSDNPSMLSMLEEYKNLVILKSLGKAFGVCGLRLGYIASADRDFVNNIKKLLPIWNVNNFAETFIRQLNRYDRQFKASCERTKRDRDAFYKDLVSLGIKAWKPDGNFILCKMPWDAVGIAKFLFEHNILVKNCGGKSMKDGDQYIRFGCRTFEENVALHRHLEDILYGNQRGIVWSENRR
jgi:histidinol-phosphate/aromatic aminotransferase/cobyric acid decarboxylase-like protein/choline kinase